MPTCVTPSSPNHPASRSSPTRVVTNCLISLRARPRPSLINAHAAIVDRCISNPAHRGATTCMTCLLTSKGKQPPRCIGPAKILPFVLTVPRPQGGSRPRHPVLPCNSAGQSHHGFSHTTGGIGLGRPLAAPHLRRSAGLRSIFPLFSCRVAHAGLRAVGLTLPSPPGRRGER